ncbi:MULTISPECIES: TasA family protein [Bacillus cereus group]|uniref:Spore coat-associated protein N n=2 Tax=Bacillus cereus group TaxID=86661 RepID=A0A9X8SH30_9BACI|nr:MULTISPECIES: TasA family protein [Bacillus cereus group]ONG71666.1 cell division protein FtsN [Bacillus cereus]MCC2537153.1 CalY family protein [Bacillus paranthracis]MCH5438162.1 CalY family protein [Bacillus paranthracis]MCM0001963.1 CalY family protein [Bacillus paranthracis]MCR6794439.1 CalY family protein [Bacillus paranthracis]
MTLKKKLGMGIASAVLGAALVGGGTFAFFSDKEVSNNTFAAGTLDLSLNPSTVVNVSNLKPGDTIEKEFKLENKGSLDIKKVLLQTEYKVEDTKKDNKDDFGKHIEVTFLKNVDKHETIVKKTTLDKLKKDTLTAVDNDLSAWFWDEKGISAGKSDKFKVKFEFVDNKKDQNEFQGDKVQLTWTFDAQQTEGEAK